VVSLRRLSLSKSNMLARHGGAILVRVDCGDTALFPFVRVAAPAPRAQHDWRADGHPSRG